MGEAKEDDDRPFKCTQCKERFKTDERLQIHRANHRLKATKGVLLPEPTPTPTKFLDASYDPFDQFSEMRNSVGEPPVTTKPRLIISPTLHTPVGNLMSPVFPTSLLTTSSGALHTPITSIESPSFPVPKLSPVPGSLTMPHKQGMSQVPTIDLQTILRGGLNHMDTLKQECMDSLLNSRLAVKQEPSSPKEERKAVIADRIRKRAEVDELLVTSDSDSIPSSNGGSSQRKRYPSEMNGQIDEKRRKFLERNRAAAQRCREKRKQWINNLQKEKFVMQEENNKLHIQVHNLRQEIMNLKSLLLQHKDCPVTKASKDGKLDQALLPPPIVFPNVSENCDIKRPSPSKPQPNAAVPVRAPRDTNTNGGSNGEVTRGALKRRITPTTSLNSDPLGLLTDGILSKDSLARSKLSPFFNSPLGSFPRSPITGLGPLMLSPNFLNMNSTVEPQYTITSLDARNNGKAPSSPGGAGGNPCPDVAGGIVVIQEALSNNCRS